MCYLGRLFFNGFLFFKWFEYYIYNVYGINFYVDDIIVYVEKKIIF